MHLGKGTSVLRLDSFKTILTQKMHYQQKLQKHVIDTCGGIQSTHIS